MATSEALYGGHWHSLVYWTEVKERSRLGWNYIREKIENIKLIRRRLLTAQNQQKSYVDKKMRRLEFEVRYHAFLRVSSIRGVLQFGQDKKYHLVLLGLLKY